MSVPGHGRKVSGGLFEAIVGRGNGFGNKSDAKKSAQGEFKSQLLDVCTGLSEDNAGGHGCGETIYSRSSPPDHSVRSTERSSPALQR